jgi:hypothetical protein
MLALDMNALSLALLGAAAVAFTRQRRAALLVCGGLFVPAAAAATAATFWPVSPAAAVLAMAATLGPSVLGLALYAVDRVFAPFCLEMTYAGMLCWVLWPVLVAVDFAGLLLR